MINKKNKIILCFVLIPLMLIMYRHINASYYLTSMPIFIPKVNNICCDPYGYISVTNIINGTKYTDNIYDNQCILKNYSNQLHNLPFILNIIDPHLQPNMTISHIAIKKFTVNNLYKNAIFVNMLLLLILALYQTIIKQNNKKNNKKNQLVTFFSILYCIFTILIFLICIVGGIFNILSLIKVSYCFSHQYYPLLLSFCTIFSTIMLSYINFSI